MKNSYVCVGGHVRSADGDIYFIPAHRVATLYGLDNLKVRVRLIRDEGEFDLFARIYEGQGRIILRPCEDGNYNLPSSPLPDTQKSV